MASEILSVVPCVGCLLFVTILMLLTVHHGDHFVEAEPSPAAEHHQTSSWDYLFQELKNLKYPIAEDYRKILQDRIPKSTPHPCSVNPDRPSRWRSETRPTSVHKLRPGDIDVIAVIGDSLSAGNAARETLPIGIMIQDRGVTYLGGGIGTWHDVTTLPNIIKVFNPNLVGYAIARGDFLSHNAQLNVAIPAALDYEIMDQVKILIKKMKNDKRIDFLNDWKLLTISIGHNNICSKECFYPRKSSPETHKLNLQKALDYLQKNVPRLFVNLLLIFDPTAAARFVNSTACNIIRRTFCSCLYKTSNYRENLVKMSLTAQKYQEAEIELVASGRYNGKEDFTVVLQPFSLSLNGPTKVGQPEAETLRRLLSERIPIWTPDCYHLNQRGQASVSIQFWNNMLEPVGNKSKSFDEFKIDEYICPTKENPYFFTNKNSDTYYRTGHQ